MKIKGIKRGKTIELSEEINIPDGQEVNIQIEVIQQMSREEKWEKVKEFLNSLTDEDREEWRKMNDFLEKERRLEREIAQKVFELM
jgi:predicted DNA-binding antitoxin AbrB/MazE fold protein